MADTPKEEYSSKENKVQEPKPEIMDASKFVALENLQDIKKNLADGTIKDINITDNEGNTVLHTNSAKGNLEIIYYLLFEYNPPADVNKKNKNGDTPSHLAAKYGNLRGLKLLFRRGADADIQNAEGFTPLDSAVRRQILYEINNEGNTSPDIEEVIKFLKKDKERTTVREDYYDTVSKEEKTEEKTEDDAIYDDSHIDNDDDLEDTYDNKTWKINKAKIKALYTVKGITQNLVNYGNNLILFYEKKISAVKELIERKSSDSTKNFVGDATIQDEQRKGIGEMLWNDPSTKKMTDDEKLDLIIGYYSEIGNQAEEIMEKDYNDRNRTIKYLLLIREYEANIESIQNAIDVKGAIQVESSDDVPNDILFEQGLDLTLGGAKDKRQRVEQEVNPQFLERYTLLVEGYKNTINSPINDPELQTYLIQYFDKLQFLIADPANVDIVQFKEVCQQLLGRINFLKKNQYGGQNGGAEYEDSSSLDEIDPNHPLYRQWKALQDSKKERDDNFNKWGDKMKELLDISNDMATAITNIQNGTLAGPQKYEDQKAAIEQVAKAQLELIEAQTKSCIDAYTKQTTDLSADLSKQQQLASQISVDTNSEGNKDNLIKHDTMLLENEKASCDDKEEEAANKDSDITMAIETGDVHSVIDLIKDESSHQRFVREYIKPNYVKNNLYEFINQCRLLDSVPSWRAKISTLMVGYLTSYVVDPNDISKHISVIPSYDYFNLVLQGTPGVGKSYSSAIIGKALKWCGFLTVGKMKEIKKPDIVGSYTGQTAPKVYNELSQGLGNVVFIDEAYSIAGAKDETKGTFNEFGQEALDAITDYTSEHIGLLAFIVAGYEYEMQNQFLNVNIGLPRRFPTVLTLRRYDMKSFWKILEMPIIKFCPKYQVDHHHHACFELLNIMFNFQWTPNPVLQISKKWPTWWEGYTLKNLRMNLKVNMSSNGKEIINVPFTKLSNFDEKIKNIESENITATSIDVIALTKLIGGNINMETATFIKAYFINKFCNIRNGDFFRSQADNLTKFGQTILSDKIINPSGLFVPDQDKNKKGNTQDKNKKGNTKWIEYIYFDLYFTKNPNKPVENINFSFQTPTTTNGGGYGYNGGSKIKRYTNKNINAKKYTRRNNGKKNKKTIHKYKNKRNKKTIRQRGGDLKADLDNLLNYFLNPKIDKNDMLFAYNKILRSVQRKTKTIQTIQDTIRNPVIIDNLNYLYQSIAGKLKQIETKADYEDMSIPEKDEYKAKLKAIRNEIHKIDDEYIKLYPPVKTESPTNDAPVAAPAVKTESPPLTIIQPVYLPTEVEDNFSTILNYYVDPSIGEQDLDKAIKEIKEKVNNLSIGELKNLFVFTTVRLRQLNDADLKVNPSKDKVKIIRELDILISDILKRLQIIDKRFNDQKIYQQLLDEATVLVKNPNLINSDEYQAIKTWPEFEKKLDLKENLNVEENIPSQKKHMNMKTAEKQQLELQKQQEEMKKQQEEMKKQQLQQDESENKSKMKNVMGEILQPSLKNINKDLVFDIVGIDFSDFRDTQEITETIVRNKIIDNEENNKQSDNEKLKKIFQTFMNKYNEYLSIFESNNGMNEKQEADLPIFIYTYLLLACYNTAFIESKKPLTKFNNDSWWFFTAGDFKIIADYLDIEMIIGNFNKLIREETGVTPAVSDAQQEKEPPEQNNQMMRDARLARFTNSIK